MSESNHDSPNSAARFQPDLDCWYLTGPTASGKTSIGIELARLLNAEIVSLDSMAIYREMDIGTAKPTIEDRQRVPHHLIDIVNPSDEFSVAQYVSLAQAAIRQIRAKGREVLFVGGTPLYLKAMLRGIFQGPAADWEFRQRVEEEVQVVGLAALHQRLTQVDPLSAAKLHPHDKRRIVRALEVYMTTGQPISHQQLQFDEGCPPEKCRVFALQWTRHALHQRIEARVRRMFESGLVDEVRTLLQRYTTLSRTACQAVGYREVIDHLSGRYGLDETVTRVQARTRQFARRQETWFRSLGECRRIDIAEAVDAARLAERIVALGTAVNR